MDKLEENLELLSSIISKTRNTPLKTAFIDFLKEFNQSMKNYLLLVSFIETISKNLENINIPTIQSKWDIEMIRDVKEK